MELIHQACDTPFWIPAVTKQEHLPVRTDLIHSAAHHPCGNLQLCLLSVPELVAQRDRKIADGAAGHDRERQQDAHHAVPIQVIGAVMRGMVKEP